MRDEDLDALIDQLPPFEPPAELRERVRRQVRADAAELRDALQTLDALGDELGQETLSPPEGLRERVRQQVREQAGEQTAGRTAERTAPPPANNNLWYPAGALLAVAAAALLWLMPGDPQGTDPGGEEIRFRGEEVSSIGLKVTLKGPEEPAFAELTRNQSYPAGTTARLEIDTDVPADLHLTVRTSRGEPLLTQLLPVPEQPLFVMLPADLFDAPGTYQVEVSADAGRCGAQCERTKIVIRAPE